MKKITFILLGLCFFNLCSCKLKKVDLSEKTNVICTIFPLYDWTRIIRGDGDYETTLNLVLKNGLSFHNYTPSEIEINQINNCDLFIYNGGQSEQWINEIIKNPVNPEQKFLNLSEVIKNVTGEEAILDEHTWLSLKYAQICNQAIYEALCEAVPQNQQMYQQNLNEFLKALSDLDVQYETTINNSSKNTLLFCDRFPFSYLTKDYNLTIYPVIPECFIETETDSQTTQFLAKKLEELDLNSVITIENNKQKIAHDVIALTKKPSCDILVLDSLQTTTLREAFNGKTYYSTMKSNLEVLKKALE